MASYHDLLDAIARVRAVTGDPDAWTKGLTGDDVTVVCNPASPPAALGAVLAKLTAAHPDVFLAPSPAGPQPPPPRIGEGAAADAIRDAEMALAHQNTDAAHVDLQVVTAVLNAHAAHDEGHAELVALQRDIEAAVGSRTDLDTPAGAREFQRYLIGKLREIRNVVENAGLDATSRASVAAALATLYASATPDPRDTDPADEPHSDSESERTQDGPVVRSPGETVSGTTPPAPASAFFEPACGPAVPTDAIDSPPFEPVWIDPPLPGPLAEGPAAPAAPPAAAPPPAAPIPAPAMPPAAMAAPPWGGGLPAAAPLGGFPSFGGPQPAPFADLPRADPPQRTRADLLPVSDPPPDPLEAEPEQADDQPDGVPITEGVENIVDLPDGDTVTAPTPELAAAITAAVGGTPIPEAFRLQGITLPAPGSVVPTPLDPARLAPGDIGLLTDRHALALGNGKILLDQRIQPIASVSGPGFLGWQHPPEPEPIDAMPEVPAPNRVAATAPS